MFMSEERRAKKRAADARWHLAHREEVRAHKAANYIAHRKEILASNAAYRNARREEIRTCQAKYRATHQKERRAYDAAHPEERRRARARYYASHREKLKADSAAYRAAHREKNRATRHSYLQTEQGLESRRRGGRKRDALKRQLRQLAPALVLTERQWEKILHLSKGRCYWCGRKRKMTTDHVIPLSKGGLHTAENVVAACGSCNSKKHTKIITLF